jgi:hypothetical protein
MNLEVTETGNDCAGEDQQQFNRPNDRVGFELAEGYIYEKLVTKTGESSGSNRNGNMHRWKPLPSNGWRRLGKLYVCCNYSGLWNVSLSESVVVISNYGCKCKNNPITNPNPVSGHTHSRDNRTPVNSMQNHQFEDPNSLLKILLWY